MSVRADRSAEVVWNGDLAKGNGTAKVHSGALPSFPVTWAARTEQPGGKTSPEELLAAAHASCYAMAFSSTLAKRGTPPERLSVRAVVSFEKGSDGWKVTRSELTVKGKVPGLDQAKFEEAARAGEKGCPISNALRNNVQIILNAQLE